MYPSRTAFLAILIVLTALVAGCASSPAGGEAVTPETSVTPSPTQEPVESPVIVSDPRLSPMAITLTASEMSDGTGVYLTLAIDPKGAAIARNGVPVIATIFAYNTVEEAPGFVPGSADEVRSSGLPYRSLSDTVYDAPVSFRASLPAESEFKNLDIGKEYVYGVFLNIRD
ncbi:MAG TPA: hypothetical protein ENN52_05510 [Methanofollis liminatans]|uniref:Uncharacterized protein n=1 Tax=Methanofollis liminatans TaxID=2201 RepID=A0A831LRG4_9EURY|nr:hypothetical protein [Methanofollis liminatans]